MIPAAQVRPSPALTQASPVPDYNGHTYRDLLKYTKQLHNHDMECQTSKKLIEQFYNNRTKK